MCASKLIYHWLCALIECKDQVHCIQKKIAEKLKEN